MDKDITVIGMDLSDRKADLYILDPGKQEGQEERVAMTRQAVTNRFGGMKSSRVIMETGTHSPWLSRLLEGMGHDVVVAHARRIRLIAESDRKTDRSDAELLARLGMADMDLLQPIRHRSAQAQADLAILHARAVLVRARTLLVNHTRGTVKSMGYRLPACSTASFGSRAMGCLPDELRPALQPLLGQIGQLTTQIRALDKDLARVVQERYPQTRLLQQVPGVGPVTALAYTLVIGDPARFSKSRKVGAYLGLTARQSQSGDQDVRSRITKTGNSHLRWLLIQCAHYILGRFGPDCDLRRYGLAIQARGGGIAKKRARVAVARKLAVLLCGIWRSGTVYESLRTEKPVTA
ncbi:MAG: IS110 family transposase [Planctomycetes bacterium]|nr:IS110 family transposase [Planctomycetota bacterium]